MFSTLFINFAFRLKYKVNKQFIHSTMLEISQRGIQMPASPIRKLAPLSDAAKAEGVKVYHLNIGQPDMPTPKEALDAIKSIDRTTLEYSPSDGYRYYRENLVEYYKTFDIQLTPEEIIVTAGGSEAVLYAFLACLNPGDEIIVPEPAYANYMAFAISAGAVIKTIPSDIETNYALPPIEKFEELINERTKGILICNPNNPTGSSFGKEELEGFLHRVPSTVMVILDEAYREYVTREDYFDALSYLDDYKNLIVLRTFSKAYGMASLRVGYGFADPELIGYFYRVVDPFDVNLFAQEAAVAALQDEEFLNEVVTENTRGKEFFYKELEELGQPYVVTDANFILWDTQRDDMEIFRRLMQKGYIIRPGGFLGIPGHIRVSISTMDHNIGFMKVYKEVLEEMDGN